MDVGLYRKVQLALVATLFAMQIFAVAVQLSGLADESKGLSWFFFIRQDVLVLAAMLAGILLLKPEPAVKAVHEPWLEVIQRPGIMVLVALLLTGICWTGHYLILLGHDLSRDEQMANFDAYIFSHGKLFWPIPEQWRPYADALNQTFILPIGDHEAWVSNYLPINAAMRAAVGTIADPALTSPLLVGVGALALWRVSHRLWPDSGSARAVALILYAGSSQVILTGMTAYAMTAHLALNLVWLALFLQDRRASHVGAILIGFLATGLHQPIFHPLVVLPFMWMLFRERRWQLMLSYGFGYALICVFWLAWPIWISSHGVGPAPIQGDTGASFLQRLSHILRIPNVESAWLTSLNLLRFVSWQHLLLMPLLGVGIWIKWSTEAVVRALAAGLAITVIVVAVLLPYQGHGWGYRYLHGIVGNACLLGAYGFDAMRGNGQSLRRAMAYASAVTFLVFIPLRAYMANKMVAPYANAAGAVAASGADVAIVDDMAVPFGQDLVLNRPDLSNAPVFLLASMLKPQAITDLCGRDTTMFVGGEELAPIKMFFGDTKSKQTSSQASTFQPDLVQQKCRTIERRPR
jgi:hypothetical protein